jgi:hypothetical protein
MGEDIGVLPGEDFKEGLRVLARLQGEDVSREMLSTAIGLWAGLDELHSQYMEGAKDHPGQLPLAELVDVHAIQNKNSTSYTPSFAIADWVEAFETPEPTSITKAEPASRPVPRVPTAKPKPRDDMDDEIPF